jgi:predicted permease
MSIFAKLKYLLLPSHRRALERDMNEELESLRAIAQAEGTRPELGSLAMAAEEARSTWSWVWLEQLRGDIRYAARAMRQSPGFTATAVLSLALGIGANTAIFGLINAILLKPLPVSDPDSLLLVSSFSRNEKIGDFGYPDFLVLRNGNSVFSGLLAASNLAPVNLGIGAESEVVQRKIVSATYFSVLGVQPQLGRIFLNEDEDLQLAVISDRLWRQRFGSAPSVLGAQVELDGIPFTIVGVAPPEFVGETVGEATDIWATIALMPPARRNARGFTWLNLMGRSKPGVSAVQANPDLTALAPQLPNRFIERITVEPGNMGSAGLRNTFALPLKILMVVVAVVLLVACTNLASLLLARTAARRREIATRLAIGAGRARVVRQLLTESALLGLIGGLVGLLFALWSQRILLMLVAGVGRTITLDLRPDAKVILFTLAISVAAGVLFGLASAIQAVRENVGETLKTTAHHLSGRRRRRWGLKDGLIAMQVALSFVLLVTGGLFIRTLHNLKTQDVGFRAANVLCLQVDSPRGYKPDWGNLIVQLTQRVEAIPGVRAATVSFGGTLANSGSGVTGFKVEGYPPSKEEQRARANWVGPKYFETSGITLLEGREFSRADTAMARKVAIINRTMAVHYFGSQSATGRRFEFNKELYEIIGVARDAKYRDLRESTPRLMYFAAMQHNSGVHSLEVRTAGSPLALAGQVRDAVRELDPRLRVGSIETLEQRVDQKLAREFLVTDVAGFFASLTLLLVCIGIYGTLAYTVARRTNEIGIRMALGARPSAIVRIVLGDVLLILAIGLAGGIAGASVVGKLVSSMLFGLKATDVSNLVFAALLMSVATLAAGYFPARRATRIQPTSALRF